MKTPERLRPLVEDGLVEEVIEPLMSGKEAAVFVVVADGRYCVAKVYKDATQRSFKNRSSYTEGRQTRNSRDRRAQEKGSRYGKKQAEEAWQNAEVDALFRLSSAGIRVPEPFLYHEGVLLMEILLDPDGNPAPRLFDVDFTEEQAAEIHAWTVRQCVLMLCAGMVHGDLSECNILLAVGGPVIIDLPQATDAAANPNARTLFVRDVTNVTNYLARFAPELATTRYGEEIWDLYEKGKLFVDTVLTGKWKGSDKKADTYSVLQEISDAAREAADKRADDDAPRGRRKGERPEDVSRRVDNRGAGAAGAGRPGRPDAGGRGGERPRPGSDRPPGERREAPTGRTDRQGGPQARGDRRDGPERRDDRRDGPVRRDNDRRDAPDRRDNPATWGSGPDRWADGAGPSGRSGSGSGEKARGDRPGRGPKGPPAPVIEQRPLRGERPRQERPPARPRDERPRDDRGDRPEAASQSFSLDDDDLFLEES